MTLKTLAVILLVLSSLVLVHAAVDDDSSAAVNKAYQCLQGKLTNRTSGSLALQEAIFATLALGNNQVALQKIDGEKSTSSNQTCWPRSSCTVKDTAQVLMAYKETGKNTQSIESYLLSRTGTATGLRWFLVLDIQNQQAATCTLRYGGQSRSVNVEESMQLSGDPGSCFTIAEGGYWLEISSSCLDRSFQVSCSQDFITSLHYKKTAGSDETLYLSPQTHSAIAGGSTNESIQSKCFRQGSECNYEASLWATMALEMTNRDVSQYIPYLRALAPENQKYLPEAFLLKLTDSQEDFSSISQSQIQEKYWKAPGTPYNQLYDTALALLSLQGRSAEVSRQNAENYLLSTQGDNGCWNDNIRDTAFLLYGGWPRSYSGSGGAIDGGLTSCEPASPLYACTSSVSSCVEGGGNILNNYDCPGALYCCSVRPASRTCSEQGGSLCSTSQMCDGALTEAGDGTCCLGQCVPSTNNLDSCTQLGGLCSSSCDPTFEEMTSDFCTDVTQVCCVQKSTTEESGSSWGWIITLVILIILVGLAILYRKKLQLWWFKMRKPKSSAAPVTVRRPPFPPSGPMRRTELPPARPLPPRQVPAKDKEMEETLKKLREMSR